MQIRPFFLIFGLFSGTICAGFAQTSPTVTPSTPSEVAPSQVPSLPPYDPDPQKSRPAPTTLPSQPTPQPSSTPPQPPPDAPGSAYPQYDTTPDKPKTDALGSAYIPMDSWVYPQMMRLYSMGYLDSAFIGMRPWTRRSALHMLQKSRLDIMDGNNEEAQEIFAKLLREFEDEVPSGNVDRGAVYGLHSVYTRLTGIGGPVLRDSYHLGQTLANDYGRPYDNGLNNITGFSTLNEVGRFSLYVRGEYLHAASGPGYSYDLSSMLARNDRAYPYAPPNRPQDTIPEGPISSQNEFRLVEASLSFHLLGHEISGGKNDAWLGPAQGGALA